MRIAQIETAIDSFHAHVGTGKACQQRERILAFIEAHGGDFSIGEIAQALNIDKSSASARINELLYQTHEVVERPKRRDRISGKQVRPVALPAMQRSLFN